MRVKLTAEVKRVKVWPECTTEASRERFDLRERTIYASHNATQRWYLVHNLDLLKVLFLAGDLLPPLRASDELIITTLWGEAFHHPLITLRLPGVPSTVMQAIRNISKLLLSRRCSGVTLTDSVYRPRTQLPEELL